MAKLFRRLRYLLRQGRMERELAREIEHHRELTRLRLEREGRPAQGAVDRSARILGNVSLAREDARAVWLAPWLEGTWQDLQYAMRSARREPAFAALVMLTLGITIGLNASVFTAFNGILVRPWPVRDPGSVVTIADAATRSDFSLVEYRYLAEHARSFSGLIATRCIDGISEGCEIDLEGAPGRVQLVTGNYFDVLGVGIERGRGLHVSDDRPDAPEAVAVISYAAWQVRFGADPAIVGRRIRLDEIPFTVVGVAAATFTGTAVDRKDIWVPMSAVARLRPGNAGVRERFASLKHSAIALGGRLMPGVPRAQAQAEMELLNRRFRLQSSLEDHGVLLMDTTFFNNPFKRKGTVSVFVMLFLGVLLVLMLACANVGNLLIARAAARRREVAVRLALGAGRWRLVRQLLTESMTLACAAAMLGLGLATALPTVLLQLFEGPVSWHLRPDASVLAFTVGLTCCTCIAFGLAPALHAGATDVARALKPSADQFEAGGARLSLRGVLLSVQVAISVTLLVCAALLVRGVWRGYSPELGFRADGVSVMRFELPRSFEPARHQVFARTLLGVLDNEDKSGGLGYTNLLPFGALQSGRTWSTFKPSGDESSVDRRLISPSVSNGYFDVLGIRLVDGRLFAPGDTADVVLVNESLAKEIWPGESAVGRTIVAGIERRIVGVVQDVIFTTSFEPEPTMYRSFGEAADTQVVFGERGRASAQAIAAAARQIEPQVRVTTSAFSDALDRRFTGSRMAALVAAILGIFAVTLAGVGVFGVFRYVVQQRTREIGIRMALGARPRQLVAFVVVSGGRALAIGLAIGLAGAFGASAILRGSLHGLSALDPGAYFGAASILALTGIVAVYLPARRATRVEPTTALRCE